MRVCVCVCDVLFLATSDMSSSGVNEFEKLTVLKTISGSVCGANGGTSLENTLVLPENTFILAERDDARATVREETKLYDNRVSVYVLTGRGYEEYAAAGGGTWSLRSVFAVCASLEGVWTVLQQNLTGTPAWRQVRCHEVPVDTPLMAPQPRNQKTARDVHGSGHITTLSQPLEASAPSLDLCKLLLHFATADELAAVALTLASTN
jgi:hypothetical protein